MEPEVTGAGLIMMVVKLLALEVLLWGAWLLLASYVCRPEKDKEAA